MAEKDDYLNKTLINGFKILECFNEQSEALTSKEISEILDLNTSLVWRLIYTLEYLGYLKKLPKGDKYLLGFKGLKFAKTILNKLEIRNKAHPYLKKLAKKIKLNLNLTILNKNKALLIDSVNSPDIPDNYFHIGRYFPLYCSSSGKILLANQPKEKIRKIIDDINFKKMTENTITDRNKLINQLKEIKEQNYAIDDEEYLKHTKCLAVPINDKTGKVVASLSMSTRKLNATQNVDIINKLDEISKEAHKISHSLGYSLYDPN